MIFKNKETPSTCALLLTGGGARAAYQIGVLKAIATRLPRNQKSPFKVISGTSAGAINAVSLACYASCYHLGVKKTEWVWKNFRTNQVYETSWRGVWSYLAQNYLSKYSKKGINRATSLFDNRPLRDLLQHLIDYKRIDRNILSGHLDAISVAASSYSDGDSVAFFQSHHTESWQRAKRKGVKTSLTTRHLMASAAIPLVFPCVRIENQFYGDGSVHQLSPLSPAIHLGADKIFIIGVEQPKQDKHYGSSEFHPNSATITGHLLETVFTDSLNSDLERMERINNTLQYSQKDKTGLKPVQSMVINPSRNFSQIAKQYYYELPSAIRFLLRFIGVNKNSESTLMSYILFEKPYTEQLIQIGFEDGMAQINEISEFLELE